jgi:predicted TPR repeat methyltransferase
MAEKFLDKVYGVEGADEARSLYDDWANSYDSEVADNGYATPTRCAKALALIARRDTELLDFGCGTGLSGKAFREAGFTTIDGMDLSPQMLEQARTKKIYRNLTAIDADGKLPFRRGAYQAIAAVGVIGSGAAPLSLFDQLFNSLGPCGLYVFSFNDHTLKDPTFEARVSDAFLAGEAKIRHREYGPHLPARKMKSIVYILEKQ